MKDEAIKYAAMPKEEFKSKWFAHNCDYIIAKAYFVSGEHESSIDILKKQIRISNTKDDKVLAEKHCLLAQNYEALSDFSNCLYHANTAKQLFRSDAGETKIVEEYIQKVELLSSKRS